MTAGGHLSPTLDVEEPLGPSGTIAGYYQYKDASRHGFVRAPDGTVTTIDVPGAFSTQPASINTKGHVAGGFMLNGVFEGFIWKP